MTAIYCSEIANYDINLITGSMSHCCKFKDIPLIKKEFEILGSRYFDSNRETVTARSDLLNGIRTPRCQDCWDHEDKNLVSWRLFKNKSRREDSLAINIQVSSLCNQACFYCSPALSSTIAKYKTWIDYHTGDIKNSAAEELSNLITVDHIIEFIKTIPKNINVLSLGLTGGEPFMLDNFEEKILSLAKSFLDLDSQNRVSIAISTNTNSKPEKVMKFYENIQRLDLKERIFVTIVSSIENLEERAEYVRDGLTWSNFIENFNLHNQYADKKFIRMTFNPFTVVNIADFVKYFSQFDLTFTYNYVSQPYFRINVLDSSFSHELTTLEEYINAADIAHKFDNNFYKDLSAMLTNDQANAKLFKRAITNLDSIKNKNWRTVFPEYQQWFDAI